MAARGPRYGRRLLSSFLTVTLQVESGGANPRTAGGQAQGVLRSLHGWKEELRDLVGIRDMVAGPRNWLQQRHAAPGGHRHHRAMYHTEPHPGLVTMAARSHTLTSQVAMAARSHTLTSHTVAMAARSHTLTAHTCSNRLFSRGSGGGTPCICSKFHSSAQVAQRSDDKEVTSKGDQITSKEDQITSKEDGKTEEIIEEEEEEDLVERYRNLTLFQRFKMMVADYGYVLIPVHVATSAVWFGSFYYMAISGVDPVPMLEGIGVPHSWMVTLKKSGASDLLVAYVLYKIATPARYTVTLGGTTFTIRYLRKKGIMRKPPPSKSMEKMKGFIQEKRDQIQEKRDQFRNK